MKKRLSAILFGILFLAGLSLLLYPFAANQWNDYRQSKLLSDYEGAVAAKEAAGQIDYEAEWARARSYNAAILPSILPDSFANAENGEADTEYMSCLNLTGDGMMGYVRIPKINVKIPIFHTTDEKVLQTAAGHLEGSSLPAGGPDTHAVISAHRGLPSATLFTDLDRLEEGDSFLLYILNDVLCYQVDKISVVEPDQTEDLRVESGQDLVTLLTCTPYGVNSHRLLVRGHRIPYEEVEDEEAPTSLIGVSPHTSYLLWVLVGLAITGVFILILYRREVKRKRAAARRRARGLQEQAEGSGGPLGQEAGPEQEPRSDPEEEQSGGGE